MKLEYISCSIPGNLIPETWNKYVETNANVETNVDVNVETNVEGGIRSKRPYIYKSLIKMTQQYIIYLIIIYYMYK